MQPDIVKKIAIPLYHGWLFVVFTDDMQKHLDKIGFKHDGSPYGAITLTKRNKRGVSQYMIVFRHDPLHSEITHECVHACNMILDDRGVKADHSNDEAQAYLCGWIAEIVYQAKDKAKIT